MSEIAARHARLAADFRSTAASVPPGRWDAPSPCQGWTAHDVVAHVIEAHLMQLGFADAVPQNVPDAVEAPVEALDVVIAAVQEQLGDPDRATQVIDGIAGQMPWETSVDSFLCFDLLVHRWDLSRAAGLPEALPPEDVRWASAVADGFGEMLHAEGVCAPPLEPPQDADEQTTFLARLGRRAW
ncbi:maleylpyruvate isomerase family mycothiol-dependent enzyme [Nesterenkonia sp. PF2B19]|uniref:maleylpyruvate isomerase family mycothiol-dependent enzyme n=1 Tax=unclassified Nesterenkonia TaxID=2629769 RepID=UPI000871E323|nr:maleylpyruvate isomerase family mycothiol-dependent enzyme [Nesterenkonia sp. PF2B19]OSM43899.1 hypothetical protein BCY76_005650 [Nesterenkonia sp. PF2B19]